MKIVTANSFKGVVRSGGSTKPWVVDVIDGPERLPYVVKLFTEKQSQQFQPIAKEVFGNVLAQEFDLTVPTCALVDFGDAFIRSLGEPELLRLQAVSNGLKFGTLEVAGASIVDVRRQRSLLKSYDIGTIFAFDNLVWNLDRGGFRNKPNLLINDDRLVLIDHEQIFPFANDSLAPNAYVMPPFNRDDWHYQFDKHLFFPLLMQLGPAEKETVFDTFDYFLRNLSVNGLDASAQMLVREGIGVGDYGVVRKHLLETKARAGEFCQFLKTLIA